MRWIGLKPEWNAPASIGAISTTRLGGVSPAPYDSLNLGDHVQDNPANVTKNRLLLAEYAQLPEQPQWLQQVHGINVITLDHTAIENVQADGVYSHTAGKVCAVMTADCLPVLFCSTSGDEVAAAHAGWRGLCNGVLEQTVACFDVPASQIIAWLGPAIGPEKFEVGAEVRQQFIAVDSEAKLAFKPHNDKYLANIYLLARQRLKALGVTQIYGGDYCTVTDKQRFFSYRRDGETGRMASLIWIQKSGMERV